MPTEVTALPSDIVKIHDCWRSMKRRCLNPATEMYRHYGGRGITVCPQWISSFDEFCCWALTAGYVPGLQLDRIDVDGNYEPDNCRFVDRATNMQNTRRAITVTAFGKTQSLRKWADERDIAYTTLHARITRGWTPERALHG